LRDAYGAIRDRGGEVVAVSTELAAVAREAVRGAGLPYPVLSDPRLRVIDRYGLRHVDEPKGRPISRPAVIVLDREGVVRYAHVGEHPRDRPALGAILLALESLQ
jgi:peroxiredoxin